MVQNDLYVVHNHLYVVQNRLYVVQAVFSSAGLTQSGRVLWGGTEAPGLAEKADFA
jgi:hypothetical protein